MKIRVNQWLKKQIEGLHLRTVNHEFPQIHTNYYTVSIRENPCEFVVEEKDCSKRGYVESDFRGVQ